MLGLYFRIEPSRIDETPPLDESPGPYAARLAREKAMDVAARNPHGIVIGADTVVSVGSSILGKPDDEPDAERMLRSLSGAAHEVWTGIAVLCLSKCFEEVRAVRSEVAFRDLSEEEIASYVATGEPMDKAGAYAIQGGAGRFVTRVKGSYHNVIGLPTLDLARILERVGVEVGKVSEEVQSRNEPT